MQTNCHHRYVTARQRKALSLEREAEASPPWVSAQLLLIAVPAKHSGRIRDA